MKKKKLVLIALALAGVMAFGVTGCTDFNKTSGSTVYEVATTLGSTSTESEWSAGVVGGSTEARKLYEEARADGYTGTFVEFLKEISYCVQEDNSAAVAEALMSAVSVNVKFKQITYTYDRFGRPTSKESEVHSSGAGVIYSLNKELGNAYIITNYHVIYDVDSVGSETIPHISDGINVILYGADSEKGAIPATYVGGAKEYDIAVLKVEGSNLLKESYARPVRAADSDSISAGERVYAIGNPEALGVSVSQGVVSMETEYIQMASVDEKGSVTRLEIRTDAAVNHGNSGGGLFNADGRLIGIVNARSEEANVRAIGYAIPSNQAIAITQNIIDNSMANDSKGVLRAMLGITVQTTDSRSVYNEETQKAYIIETVEVKGVESGTACDGKLTVGDLIYSIRINDGEEKVVTRRHIIGNVLLDVRFGDTVSLVIYRDGATMTVTANFDNKKYFKLFN